MSDTGQNSLVASGGEEAADALARENVAEEDRIAAWTAGKALLSVLPGGGAVVEVVNGIQAVRQSRQLKLLQIVVEHHGVDLQQLKTSLDSDEDLADLVMRGMDAAAKARFEEKIAVLAAIVAKSVDAPKNERVKDRMLTQVLESIEEEHIEVLVKIEEWPAVQIGEDATQEDKERSVCSRDNLIASLPDLSPVVRMLLNALESQQLIVNSTENTWFSVAGGAHYALTDLGKELMDRLRDEYVRLRS